MKSHRQLYPEQYSHPLCGKLVSTSGGFVFRVDRVIDTPHGQLAPVPGSHDRTAFAVSTLTEINRIYYAKHIDTGRIILITHGQNGYCETKVVSEQHARILNRGLGNTEGDVEAAVMCSMFDCWQDFDHLAEVNNGHIKKAQQS